MVNYFFPNHTYIIVALSSLLMLAICRKHKIYGDRTLEVGNWKLFLTEADDDERLNFLGYKRYADQVTYDYHIRTFLIFGRKLNVDRVIETGERNRGV